MTTMDPSWRWDDGSSAANPASSSQRQLGSTAARKQKTQAALARRIQTKVTNGPDTVSTWPVIPAQAGIHHCASTEKL